MGADHATHPPFSLFLTPLNRWEALLRQSAVASSLGETGRAGTRGTDECGASSGHSVAWLVAGGWWTHGVSDLFFWVVLKVISIIGFQTSPFFKGFS